MIAWLYKKIFIAIVPDGGVYEVRAVSLQQKKVLHKESARFEGTSAFEDMVKFVRKQIDDSPYHYIAVLNPDLNQGAISGCSLHDVIDEIGGAKTLCRNEKWLLYASLLELESLKKTYAPIGLDYVFSPFSIIENFFADKIGSGFGLYALAQKDAFSVVFFDEGRLEYAHHYPMHRKLKESAEEESMVGFTLGVEEEDIQKSAEIEAIASLDDLDLIEELDSLSDIEDLDELEEIADFSEDELTMEEKRLNVGHPDEIKFEMDRFNEDYERFEFIQKTLAHFYASEQCRNRFVETVYIADAYGTGSELKRYLEEELFLSVLIRRIDLGDEVISLSMSEEESR